MALLYSKVCDTDSAAYIAYCLAFTLVNHGSSVGEAREVVGRADLSRFGSRGADVVGDSVVGRSIGCCAGRAWLGLLGDACGGCGGRGVGHCSSGTGLQGSRVGGIAVDGDVGGGGDARSGDCDASGRGDVGNTDGASDAPVPLVSAKTLANREKRHARVERKRVRKAKQAEEDSVPEWRRKNVRAIFHKGKFADCSEDTRKELLETQAKMLVEQNKTAIAKAEHERRRTEARMKSRLVEEEVETARLRMAAEYEKLAAASIAKRPSGFAETIVSAGGSATSVSEVVSPVSQSVSPDSSISVAELRAKNEMLDKLAEKVSRLELDLKKKDDEVKKKDDEVKRLRVVNKSPVRKGHASDAFFEQPRNGGYSSWDL